VVASTNKNLEDEIDGGNFREDLFYRLNVIPFYVPPLRERMEDVPLLADHFLKEFTTAYGRKAKELTPEAYHVLQEYSWPGNVRELRNVLESLIVQDHDGVLALDDLDEGEPLRRAAGGAAPHSGADTLLGRPLAEVERYYMNKALELTNGNREEAAKLLGIGERTLYRRIKENQIEEKQI